MKCNTKRCTVRTCACGFYDPPGTPRGLTWGSAPDTHAPVALMCGIDEYAAALDAAAEAAAALGATLRRLTR